MEILYNIVAVSLSTGFSRLLIVRYNQSKVSHCEWHGSKVYANDHSQSTNQAMRNDE
jgi:hypothetical protein